MQHFRALATDYNGTIAHDGVVDEATLAALERLKQTGRALRSVGTVLLIGPNSLGLIEVLSHAFGRPCPALPDRAPEVGEAVYWECREDAPPILIAVGKPKGDVKRQHTRKYAEGTLGADRSFFFRGPNAAQNIRAQNLSMFLQVGDGVDRDSYLFHLRNGDFETWMRTSIKDQELADDVANIAANQGLDLDGARKLVRTAIEGRYTAPATSTMG